MMPSAAGGTATPATAASNKKTGSSSKQQQDETLGGVNRRKVRSDKGKKRPPTAHKYFGANLRVPPSLLFDSYDDFKRVYPAAQSSQWPIGATLPVTITSVPQGRRTTFAVRVVGPPTQRTEDQQQHCGDDVDNGAAEEWPSLGADIERSGIRREDIEPFLLVAAACGENAVSTLPPPTYSDESILSSQRIPPSSSPAQSSDQCEGKAAEEGDEGGQVFRFCGTCGLRRDGRHGDCGHGEDNVVAVDRAGQLPPPPPTTTTQVVNVVDHHSTPTPPRPATLRTNRDLLVVDTTREGGEHSQPNTPALNRAPIHQQPSSSAQRQPDSTTAGGDHHVWLDSDDDFAAEASDDDDDATGECAEEGVRGEGDEVKDWTYQKERLWSRRDRVADEDEENEETLSRLPGMKLGKPVHFDTEINGVSTSVPIIKSKEDADKLRWRMVHSPGVISSYPTDLYADRPRITQGVLSMMKSPLHLLLFFLPLTFWLKLAEETNRYAKQQLRDSPKLPQFQEVTMRELLTFLGLLISRTLHPYSSGLKEHWRTTALNSHPPGTFGFYMSRDRFFQIRRYLHLSDNDHPNARTDRLWKLRPVVDTLNETFEKAYVMGCKVSFDEGILPNHSKYNPIKQYNRMKPHKWGVKLFMVCCAETAYCNRFEVYCGKKHITDFSDTDYLDTKTGPAALIRNLRFLMDTSSPASKRLVICDRFYTSVPGFLQLLTMNMYAVGTIIHNRVGFPASVVIKKNQSVPRGAMRFTTSETVPGLCAVSWKDSKVLHLLSTGLPNTKASVIRRVGKEKVPVETTENMKVYQDFMSGVDRHDQLRLSNYSIQMHFAFKKWYLQTFLGFLDLAIVNSYILWNQHFPKGSDQFLSHKGFLDALESELLYRSEEVVDSVKRMDNRFYDWRLSEKNSPNNASRGGGHQSSAAATDHKLERTPPPSTEGRTSKQLRCIVCRAVLHIDRKVTTGCLACGVGLCNTSISAIGDSITCFGRFHDDWNCDKRKMRMEIKAGYKGIPKGGFRSMNAGESQNQDFPPRHSPTPPTAATISTRPRRAIKRKRASQSSSTSSAFRVVGAGGSYTTPSPRKKRHSSDSLSSGGGSSSSSSSTAAPRSAPQQLPPPSSKLRRSSRLHQHEGLSA